MPRRDTGGRGQEKPAQGGGKGEGGGRVPLWPELSAAAQPGLTSLNTFHLAASLIANTTEIYIKCVLDMKMIKIAEESPLLL